jgi:hypothetical protein
MMHPARYDTKMMAAPLENKGHRVPTGAIDRRLAVRLDTSGPVPELVIETLGRSPAEVADDAFHPIGTAVSQELQYADVLVEAIAKARAA